MCNKSWEVWCVFCLLLSCSRLDFKLWAWNLLKSLNQAHIPTWTRSKKQFFAAWDAAALQGQLGPAVAVCCTGEGLENDCYIWSLKDTLQCWEMVVFQDKDLRTMTARVDLGCTMGDRSCNGVFALRYFEGGLIGDECLDLFSNANDNTWKYNWKGQNAGKEVGLIYDRADRVSTSAWVVESWSTPWGQRAWLAIRRRRQVSFPAVLLGSKKT